MPDQSHHKPKYQPEPTRSTCEATHEIDPIVATFHLTPGRRVVIRLSQLSPALRAELDRLGEFDQEQ